MHAQAPSMSDFRAVVYRLCDQGDGSVTGMQLIETFKLSIRAEQKKIRNRLLDMERKGELQKAGQGKWTWTGEKVASRGGGYDRIWRAIKSAKGSCTIGEIVALSGCARGTVYEYMRSIRRKGFIEETGKKTGKEVHYRITAKGKMLIQTPKTGK